MRVFGLEISRAKDMPGTGAMAGVDSAFSPIDGRGAGWFPIIREGDTGDWQRKIVSSGISVLQSVWVFRCISLIASDISKLCPELRQEDNNGCWVEATSAAFSPVLTKPNAYQNRMQFIESWVISKLTRGNAYILKERDQRNVVVALHVLHPDRCWPLVAPDGSVFYRLGRDLLAGVGEPDPDFPAAPASEIIHDRWNCLFHPLVGLSPIFACGMAGLQGVSMQSAMTHLFRNGARPGGILTAPGAISDVTASRLKNEWEKNFSGENAGRVAVLGDGLTFSSLMMTAADAQLLDQMKFNGESIAACFGVPAYMINLDAYPRSVAIEALNQMYYGQCLQVHIEAIELGLDEGLALPSQYAVKFDLDGLLRMDQAAQITALVEGVGGGLFAPNEARGKVNLPPVPGGATPYLQQQNYSLAALGKRDAQDDPFGTAKPPAPAAPPDGGEPSKPQADDPAAAGKWFDEVMAHVDLGIAA